MKSASARQRSDALGHVTGKTPYYADRQFSRHAASEDGAQPASSRAHQIDRCQQGAESSGRRARAHRQGRAANIYTILCLIQVEPNDEPVLAFDKVRCKGEQVVAILADSERRAQEAAAKVKVDYEELPAVFDVEEALKPGAPLVNEYHGQNYFTYEGHHCRRVRFGDVEKGFAAADHILEETYQSSPDRARADRDDGLHRRARPE